MLIAGIERIGNAAVHHGSDEPHGALVRAVAETRNAICFDTDDQSRGLYRGDLTV
jgi:hypothetical protein